MILVNTRALKAFDGYHWHNHYSEHEDKCFLVQFRHAFFINQRPTILEVSHACLIPTPC
jgi:hypothetical protein